MRLADRAQIASHEATDEGYLLVRAKLSRTGIYDYYGGEIGEHPRDKVFKVYRSEDEVFSEDALRSFSLKPVTADHPQTDVSPASWKRDAVGVVGETVTRDGIHTFARLLITDAAAVDLIRSGTVELSCGYQCDLILEPGVSPEGEAYDARQSNIRGNHVAIVRKGRCGPTCRVGDAAMQDCKGKTKCTCTPDEQQKDAAAMKTVTLDGKTFEVADDVAAAISKAQADAKKTSDTLADAVKVIESATTTIDAAKQAKTDADKVAADAKAAAEAAAKAVPTADQLHAMAAELSTVIDAAKRIAPDLDVKGKTVAAIKSDAVVAKMGDAAIKDRSPDYIAATFDLLATAANDADPVAKAIASGTQDGGDARKNYVDNLSNAWKQ